MSTPTGTFYADAAGYNPFPNVRGKLRAIIGTVAWPASSVAGSVATFPKCLRWDDIIVPALSFIANEAMGASVTVGAGVQSPDGTNSAPLCLMAQTAVSSAGSRALLDTLAKFPALTAWGKPLWVVAGLTKCPDGPVDLILTTAAATTSASILTMGVSIIVINTDG